MVAKRGEQLASHADVQVVAGNVATAEGTKALIDADPENRGQLGPLGLLTRDPRVKERKKYGQRGARARFQFSKR